MQPGHVNFLDLRQSEIEIKLQELENENQRSIQQFNTVSAEAEQLR